MFDERSFKEIVMEVAKSGVDHVITCPIWIAPNGDYNIPPLEYIVKIYINREDQNEER